MVSISNLHKEQLLDIRRRLSEVGHRESNFITIELLFYEAISIARSYGNDRTLNRLLSQLKDLEENEYRQATAYFKKGTQREKAIKHFISRFRVSIVSMLNNQAPLLTA